MGGGVLPIDRVYLSNLYMTGIRFLFFGIIFGPFDSTIQLTFS